MQLVANDKTFSSTTALLKAIAAPVMTAAAVAIMIAAAIKLTNSTQISGVFGSPNFILATLIAIAYRMVNPIGWNLVLGGLGYRTKKISCIRIWLMSESRRWLPGGIWGYASRATRAGELGVPVSVASASMLLELLVTMAAATILTILGALLHYDDLAATVRRMVFDKLDNRLLVLIACGGLLILCAIALASQRSVARKLLTFAERMRILADVKLNWTKIGSAVGYMIVMAVINGTIGCSLLPVVDRTASVPVAAMVAATSAAWIVGFLAVFSPGGLFVREATLATLLLPWIPYETGIAMAVLSRLAQLIAEVICILPLVWPKRLSLRNLS